MGVGCRLGAGWGESVVRVRLRPRRRVRLGAWIGARGVRAGVRSRGRPARSRRSGRLQPYVSQAATLCIPGCNPMYPRPQPCASQAATLRIPGLRDLGVEAARGGADDEDRGEDAVGYGQHDRAEETQQLRQREDEEHEQAARVRRVGRVGRVIGGVRVAVSGPAGRQTVPQRAGGAARGARAVGPLVPLGEPVALVRFGFGFGLGFGLGLANPNPNPINPNPTP